MRLIQEIYPVRKNEAQKEVFRAWLKAEGERLGYSVKEERNGSSVNVIVGDVETAEWIMTTHYDTPARRLWPDWHFPRNVLAFLGYQALQTLWMVALSLGVMLATALLAGNARLGLWAFVAAFLAQIVLVLAGPASKQPYGSGLQFVLNEMAALPENRRSEAAFIFWDNSCKGLLGARAWAKTHPKQAYTALVVNVDALSPEGDWLLMPRRLARSQPAYAQLENQLRSRWGSDLRCYSGLGCVAVSDERAFRCGVTLTRCRRLPLIGYGTREKG